MNTQQKVSIMGTYVAAAMDAAQARGWMSDEAVQTMLRALAQIHEEFNGKALILGTEAHNLAKQERLAAGPIAGQTIPAETQKLIDDMQARQRQLLAEAQTQ